MTLDRPSHKARKFCTWRNPVASLSKADGLRSAEMDREQKAWLENRGRGLGLFGAWEGKEGWYGGRIQQIAMLRRRPGAKGYNITLDRLQLGRSNRVTRFVGSRSILQVRIEQKLVREESSKLMDFLARRHILCGRVFHPFYAKENKVYLVECSDHERTPKASEGDQYRLSWDKFIEWHNPFDLNAKQVGSLCK